MATTLSQFIGSALRWWKEGAIASVLSIAVAILVYLVIGRNGDLVAWYQRTPIYPSQQTKDLSLPLFLSETPVKSLTFVNMQISNSGKATIGRQEEPWTFRVTGPPEAKLVLVGELRRSSNRLVLSPTQSSAANVVAVNIGALEPREFFEVRFIIANASNPSFQVGTSLRGLPDPIQTDASPVERAAAKLAPWFWAALFALLMYEAIANRHAPEKGPGMLREVKDWRLRLAGQAVLGILMSGLVAIFFAFAIGWIAVTLWQWGFLS